MRKLRHRKNKKFVKDNQIGSLFLKSLSFWLELDQPVKWYNMYKENVIDFLCFSFTPPFQHTQSNQW